MGTKVPGSDDGYLPAVRGLGHLSGLKFSPLSTFSCNADRMHLWGFTLRPVGEGDQSVMAPESEQLRLEQVAADSWYAKSANAATIRYSAKIFSRHWRGTRCLELGPAEGLMTPVLAASFPELTIVEGSNQFCESLRTRFPSANIVQSLFEHFRPVSKFDTIILGHVLEHVDSAPLLLQLVRNWLNPHGVICSAVPNARSLHRQAAVLMGFLPTEHSLSEADLHHGHRRVYDPESYRAAFRAAGLKIHAFGGYWLKPLSNAQIEQAWTWEMLDAFLELGERYPDIAGE